VADILEGLLLFEGIIVIALAAISDEGETVVRLETCVFFRTYLGLESVKHSNEAAFDHHKGKEGHHVGRPFRFFDATPSEKVGGIPDGGSVL
jgi:hypothetical protein